MAVAVPFGVPLAKRTLSRYTLSSAEVARGGQDGALAGRRGRGAPHLSWPDTGDAGLSQQGSEPSVRGGPGPCTDPAVAFAHRHRVVKLSSGVAEDGSVSWDAGSDSDHDSAELGDAGEAQGDASAAESAALGTAADSTSEELARLGQGERQAHHEPNMNHMNLCMNLTRNAENNRLFLRWFVKIGDARPADAAVAVHHDDGVLGRGRRAEPAARPAALPV